MNAERREMLDRLMAYLEKHILPETNDVEIEISQPPTHDKRAEALDPLGMVHLVPGPDIYIRIDIALGKNMDPAAGHWCICADPDYKGDICQNCGGSLKVGQ